MLPLVRLAGDGAEHSLADAIDELAGEFQLSDAERAELLPSGRQSRFNNRVGCCKETKRQNQVANLADVGWHENTVIGSEGPDRYVSRLRDILSINDDEWGRMCAEHALPLGWEHLDYDAFLVERRERMADIIRVAYRKLGGEPDAAPVSPPWFLPGAEIVWRLIVDAERGLRGVVRAVYVERFGDDAANRIEAALSPDARETLQRALRSRPAGADPLGVVDTTSISRNYLRFCSRSRSGAPRVSIWATGRR